MTDPVLSLRRDLAEGGILAVHEEERIVPESSGSAGGAEDRAVASTLSNLLESGARVDEGRRTDVVSGAEIVGNVVQPLEEELVVGLVERLPREVVTPGESLRPDPGAAAEGVDAEAGVVGENQGSRAPGEILGLGEGVRREGVVALEAFFFRFGANRGLGEVDDLQLHLLEDPADLAELIGASGGDEEAHHSRSTSFCACRSPWMAAPA